MMPAKEFLQLGCCELEPEGVVGVAAGPCSTCTLSDSYGRGARPPTPARPSPHLLGRPVDGSKVEGPCGHLGAAQVVCPRRQHLLPHRLWALHRE